MTRSFRDLLAIRFAFITTVGMVICVTGTFFILRHALDAELNANILNVAAIQAAALTDVATGEMHFHEWDLTPDEADAIQELVRYAQVWDGEGGSLLRSQYMTGDLPVTPQPLLAAAGGQLTWEESTYQGVPIRSALYPLARLGAAHVGHVLQVAAPLVARNAMLGRVAVSGAILVLLVALGSVLGGRWLAGRAVQPVSEIIDEAEAVGGGSMRQRIRTHADTQEYQRLVQVLNKMLDRIQAAFEVQRRFTADASHELRSPLTAIRGELELALRRNREPEEYREVLRSAREEVVRLGRIVEGLLVLARSDSGAIQTRLQRVDLRELVWRAVDRASSEFGTRRVRLDIVAPDEVPGLFDLDLVEQLTGNLIENAVRYAGEGGKVRVSVSRGEAAAVLSVEDSGPGLPPGSEEEAFERFWRADPSRTQSERSAGTGLGLAIVKVIAEAHGGSVSASNNSSLGGASLVVELPLMPLACDSSGIESGALGLADPSAV